MFSNVSKGWVENTNSDSKLFHFKWVLRKSDIDYDALTPHQSVNHFEKNTSITTKVGLARNIRNLVWFANEDIDKFYPRCHDLNDVQEFDDFIEDFKLGKAIAVLRLVTSLGNILGTNEKETQVLKLRVCIALNILEKRLKPIEVTVEDIVWFLVLLYLVILVTRIKSNY